MTTIRFQEDAYQQAAHALTEAAHALTDCAAKLPVAWGIGQPALEARLSACKNRVYATANQARALGTAARKAADILAERENSLIIQENVATWLLEKISGIGHEDYDPTMQKWMDSFNTGMPFPYPWLTDSVLSALLAVANDPARMAETFKDMVADQIVKAGTFSDKVSADGSLYSTGFTNQYGSGNLTVSAYEAKASYNAMLFGKDADGNLVFNPALDLAAGVSYTLLSANVNQSMEVVPGISAGYGGDVTVGKVDANANVSIGLMNPDGSFNPHAKASVNAQATLFEANAHGNVDVLGVNTTVEGGVTVGIGAHANVGYSDGVINADIGAAMGIGVNLNVSVDVSGVVDTAMNVCECAGDFFSWIL